MKHPERKRGGMMKIRPEVTMIATAIILVTWYVVTMLWPLIHSSVQKIAAF